MHFGLQAQTLRALEAMVPAGRRSTFADQAIRHELGQLARRTGAGDLPGERLTALADALREMAEVLDREAEKWGS